MTHYKNKMIDDDNLYKNSNNTTASFFSFYWSFDKTDSCNNFYQK